METSEKHLTQLLFWFVLVVLAGAVWWITINFDAVKQNLNNTLERAVANVGETVESLTAVSAVTGLISNSGQPIVATEFAEDTNLTQRGILSWTNKHRIKEKKLHPLEANETLNAIAEARLNDMFEKQYFAHYSPSGVGAGDIAHALGYDFIAVGENIALGNFGDDENVVQAWMDSPGHRENILKPMFTELGVAAAKGVILGQETWVAVQIFGTPATACAKPDTGLKAQIDARYAEITQKHAASKQLLATVKGRAPESGPALDAYNDTIAVYNSHVADINAGNAEIKKLADTYNQQVKAYNSCVNGLQ